MGTEVALVLSVFIIMLEYGPNIITKMTLTFGKRIIDVSSVAKAADTDADQVALVTITYSTPNVDITQYLFSQSLPTTHPFLTNPSISSNCFNLS